ncbi:acyl-ACP--UDP-N-acetylglucosamine O-acyltransferase [candidate division WOR-3 bacterium]|nr:acyl-ACP--UDP-N-acetylglucosamine O-acyltransferase [candidate division WOR-3 bacterium]
MKTCISDKAVIGERVTIGPYTIIEDDVEVGKGTSIGSHVIIRNGSIIGENNKIYNGVHIGADPQDYHYAGEHTQCVIGNGNTIREYTTLSRATGGNNKTVIGDNNFIMTYVHVAHNDMIGSDVVIASGAQIGGYVVINDQANIGGLCGIHQFCRIGAHAMLGAKSYLNQDLLPYVLAQGNRARVYGVNVRGLRRRGFTANEVEAIKELYWPLFGSCIGLEKWLTTFAGSQARDDVKTTITDFVRGSKRGILLRTGKR